jgi:hypothetical protein
MAALMWPAAVLTAVATALALLAISTATSALFPAVSAITHLK